MFEQTIRDITFKSDTKQNLTLREGIYENDRLTIKVALSFPPAISPECLTIEWCLPLGETVSIWTPSWGDTHSISPNWSPVRLGSRSASNLPVCICTDIADKNTLAVALTDVRTPSEFSIGVVEESGELVCKLTLFAGRTEPMERYECELIIDREPIFYADKAREISDIWRVDNREANVPDAAKLPMYSTWYSMHQQLDSDDLISELRLAKEFGMDSVIVDDGWQTDDNNRGYAFCGDWEPTSSKIPDMKALVDGVHSVGMKFILWYSVPFVGVHSRAYERFKDKFHHSWDGVGVLDPRYPDVRDYLCGIYEDAVKNWGLDGFKLDFIDSFHHNENETPSANDQMDYSAVHDAVCALLDEIRERLTAIKPDILIEFRQSYIGPIMRRLGNMLRVGDCPADIHRNRTNGINLRLLTENTAVHSDMLMWHPDSSAESAALQIANAFFLVPQISVRIEKLPDGQKKMLAFYLGLWREWRNTLLFGRLIPHSHAADYTSVDSVNGERQFTVLYARRDFELYEGVEKLSVINASWQSPTIIRNLGAPFSALITVRDCKGEVTNEYPADIPKGLFEVEIPDSGVLTIEKLD